MALLRTMGVDLAAEGALEVTVSTGPRARGLQGREQPALVLSARRESLSAACLAMQGLSDSYVFLRLCGPAAAGGGAGPAGRAAGAGLLCPGRGAGAGGPAVAGAGTTAAGRRCESGGEQGVESRLSTLQTDGEMGAARP